MTMQWRRRYLQRVLWLTLLTLAASGQTADQPYFAISSNATFAPGEQPKVELSSVEVGSLEFRVYKINDPVAFFSKLEDPHTFGGQAPRPPLETAWLERFHQKKHRWRVDVVRFLHDQFSEHTINAFHLWRSPPVQSRASSSAEKFATPPLLNPRQLMATWRQPGSAKTGWVTEAVKVPVQEKGVYLVEAARDQLRAFTIVMITDLAMITKTSEDQLQVFVANRRTGAPAAQARVLLMGTGGPVEARTDGRGLAQLKLPPGRGTEPQVIALAGGDLAVNSVSAYTPDANDWLRYRTLIYTDRPVYRPGHHVYFKGIIREKKGVQYGLPTIRNVDVEIQSASDEKIYQKTLPLSPFGTVAGDVTLANTAALGAYRITFKLGTAETASNFEVLEYKKPEYEVRVTPGRKRILQGEKLEAVIDARYFFGEPVANAKVKYVLHRYRYYSPLLWDPAEFGDDGGEEAGEGGDANPSGGGDEAEEHDGKLDSDGKLTVSLPIPVAEKKVDFVYALEARVTDAGNREISGTGWVVATYGSFLVRVTPDHYFAAPGKPIKLAIRAIDYDGKPIRTAIRITVSTWEWRRKEGAVVAQVTAQTNDQGEATQEVTTPAGSSFKIVASARTPEGRDVENDAYLYSWGGAGDEEDRQKIQIIPDKKTYRPGETAHILLVTGTARSTILASVEGRMLGQTQVLAAPHGTATMDVPITENSVPDFFLAASALRENRMYQGSKRISVPATGRKLDVKITPSKPQYLPGEAAEYTVEARDAAGQPVSAEVSLGVVDEAIYGVRTDSTPEMLGVFYQRGYNTVNTGDSLGYYFRGEAGRRRMELAQLHHGRALAQLKPERLVLPKVRKAFPDTVLWVPALTTGANGIAKAKLTFPDSITTFRATARAVTPDTKVGSAINKTIVRKNIILRLVIPRFFTQGDQATISAVVHNYLASEKKARVSMEVAGLDLIDGGTRDVTIPSRGEVKVDWRVRASRLGQAKMTGKALTNEESDAVEMAVPVEPAGVKLIDARNGTLTDAASTEQTLALPAALVPDSQALEIRVAPSVAGALFGAVNYLTQFPYGCTEQTLSSFVPNAVVASALQRLGVKSDVNKAELQEKLTAGLERLKDFQHPDGGWGWWKTDESEIFMTAAAVSGLAQAREAGVAVPQTMTRRGSKWLKQTLAATPRLMGDLQAYALYALALDEQADAALVRATAAKRNGMSPYGVALLGLASDAVHDTAGATAAARALTASAHVEVDEAWWQSDRDDLLGIGTDTSAEATAQVLRLLIRTDRASPLIPKAATWLLNHRREGAWWYSTKQTAMVIYGLTDYLQLTGELKPDLAATVSVNGKKISAHTFGPEDALRPSDTVIRIPAADLNGRSNTVRIETEGKGRLYWSVRSNYFSAEPKLAKTGTLKLNLLRDYFRLTPRQEGDRVVHTLNALNGPVTVGDVLAIRLTVTGNDWRYLLIEDPIPAGTEFIENDRVYRLEETPPWWQYFYSRREMHDDRVAIFQTDFRTGQQQYFYLLKVVNPGQFRVSPAKVQPMYQPSIFSTSEPLSVEVK